MLIGHLGNDCDPVLEMVERPSKFISDSIGVDDCLIAFFSALRISVFQSHDPFEAFLVNMAEDVAIVDLARPGFFAPWVITTLEICNFIPAIIDVWDEVSFTDLLVVNIKQNFTGRMVDGLADLIRLR